MNYKREEPFRYEFTPPLTCSYNIIEVGHLSVNTSIGYGEVLDLSQNGVRLGSKLNIPLGKQVVKIKLNFIVNFDVIIADGILVWRKECHDFTFQYGVKFVNTSDLPEVITEELKTFTKLKLSQ